MQKTCYLHGNRLNLEDNSEIVKIGKAIHEDKAAKSNNSEIEIDNIKLDKLTAEYLTEIKKSDADMEAGKWQLLYYLKILKSKGIVRKGKLECIEKLILKNEIPEGLNKPTCKKCAYYEFCYI